MNNKAGFLFTDLRLDISIGEEDMFLCLNTTRMEQNTGVLRCIFFLKFKCFNHCATQK